ncbi:hypothetical protein HanXRQr2_Chr12g0544741 [Helianthus annuus]|uniref:Uncharacterized protein n=1 Tax=Helianthus annuus TaxID=4232 RepID=A0A9K3HH03_HELAN|nr:hypothetical protein HanXRQr2_Chr12g0544741 [Helianthus annuus]
MSGEGSSSGVKRKRRGTRAQGAAEEQPAVAPLRKVSYRDDGTPHSQSTVLLDNPLLRFLFDTDKRIDWDLVRQLGQVDRLEQLFGPKFRLALDCDEPQYHQLTLEFHSTFQYRHRGGFDEPDVEVEIDTFRCLLRGEVKKRKEHCVVKDDLAKFWRTIANTPFSNNMVASDIRDPLLKFVHKILAATLIGRHEGDNKVNHHSLFCLMCMVENRPANLASVLAWSFVRPKKGGKDSRLFGGPYITRLAESLGVFADFPVERMRAGPAPSFMELGSLQQAGIVTYDDPPVWYEVLPAPPSPDPAVEEATHTTISKCYQVPLQRHQLPAREYPIREPRPDPLTLESLYDRVEQVRQEMRDVRQEVEQVRQEMRAGIQVLLAH